MGFRTENGWYSAPSSDMDRSYVPGTTLALPLQKGWPSLILKAFIADFNQTVEPLWDGRGYTDEGGWTPTNDVATSNHLGGTAADLNWNRHQFKVSYSGFNQDEIAAMRTLIKFYEGTVFWAQDWDYPKDPMHIQMGYGTYSQAWVSDFARRKIRSDGWSTFGNNDEDKWISIRNEILGVAA